MANTRKPIKFELGLRKCGRNCNSYLSGICSWKDQIDVTDGDSCRHFLLDESSARKVTEPQDILLDYIYRDGDTEMALEEARTRGFDLGKTYFTGFVKNYPFRWIGSGDPGSSGVVSVYYNVAHDSYMGEGAIPGKRDLVLESDSDSSDLFRVVYSNEEFRRMIVEPTDIRLRYNEILREHISGGGDKPHPKGSKLFLERIGNE